MSVISWLKGVWQRLFKKEIQEKFSADIQLSDVMEAWITKFYQITSGKPYWIDEDDGIKSINMAALADDITAGLVALDLKIEMPDTPRGEYLQKQADYVLEVIQDKVSDGLGNCGMIFKPNGKNVDYIPAGEFYPTDTDSNGNILGCVFPTRIKKDGWIYTRLEWQRFEGDSYRITNYAYKTKWNGLGDPCKLSDVEEWRGIEPDVSLLNVKEPLFAYFKNPAPNRFDRSSPLGVPIWHNAMEELENLDVAWSRKARETKNSKHIMYAPEAVIRSSKKGDVQIEDFVKPMNIGKAGEEEIYEHLPTFFTEQRIKDINSILAMFSTKCGFSQGFFVLDEKSGRITATQVEADDQQTIDTINNIHGALKDTLMHLFYALNVMEDLYGDTPPENWDDLKEEIAISYHDFTENPDEDRMRALTLTREGFYPKWYYLNQYEGFTEDEARQRIAEAQEEQQPEDDKLFEEE